MFNHNLKVSCQFNKWNSELAIICYVNKLLFPLLKTLFKYMFKAYFYMIVCSEPSILFVTFNFVLNLEVYLHNKNREHG